MDTSETATGGAARCPKRLVYSRVLVAAEPSPVRAELDRLSASFAKAGTRDYISVQAGVEEVKLLGPPREHPAAPGSARSGRRSSYSVACRTMPGCRRCGGR